MSDKKYYTPSIEEFHVGFEFEIWDFGFEKYTPQTFDFNLTNAVSINLGFEDENIRLRVKYLDREDIESFEFVYKKQESQNTDNEKVIYDVYVNKAGYKLFHLKDVEGNTLSVNVLTPTGETLFSGNIKNKSQLKQILQWTGILK